MTGISRFSRQNREERVSQNLSNSQNENDIKPNEVSTENEACNSPLTNPITDSFIDPSNEDFSEVMIGQEVFTSFDSGMMASDENTFDDFNVGDFEPPVDFQEEATQNEGKYR